MAVWLGAVAGGAVAVAAVGGGWRLHLVCLVTLFFFSCVFAFQVLIVFFV